MTANDQKPERKKQRRHLPKVDKEFIRELGSMTGFRKEEVRLAYAACMKIIRDQLSAGKEVHVPHVGKFIFVMAKPRRVPQRRTINGAAIPALNLGERLMLKFKVKNEFKKHVRLEVKPKVVRRHQRWSDVRKAAKMANQILSSEQTASPSTQLDTEPATSQWQGCNSHIHEENLETVGKREGQDCKSGIQGIEPIVPAESPLAPYLRNESAPEQCAPEPTTSPLSSELQPPTP